MIKALSVFGTRPEAIKMAPLVKALEADTQFQSEVCVTAQHRQMLDQVLHTFSISPKWDLDIMRSRQTLSYITSAALDGMDDVLSQYQPDILLVHGDTTTTFAAALAAFYHQIPVGHVEAGLRSFDKYSPFPEEMNRALCGRIATLHFAPTQSNKQNLLDEGIRSGIFVTGNTVVDAMGYTVADNYRFEDAALQHIRFDNMRTVLLTAHRRENLGEGLSNICLAARDILDNFEDVQIIYPVHKNPAVVETAQRILGNHPRAHLIEPVSVLDLHNLMARCTLILTDSGGIQEEAPTLGVPVLVLRKETERPEVVQQGGARLVGTDQAAIASTASTLLTDAAQYQAMAQARNPYGDGKASGRILQAIKHHFGQGDAPQPFVP
ncbi:UDP-N-acetylglucosamine 2-epimerase (non-hydrolyzing) [Eubacteriales bacterium OttesenSCG-928-N14]|nr:UDP-N-acetylglucosamine 2-epimerase (non-hydrolyzing) [Eubacteriales bacterium OttesenSCG-928-N14]